MFFTDLKYFIVLLKFSAVTLSFKSKGEKFVLLQHFLENVETFIRQIETVSFINMFLSELK